MSVNPWADSRARSGASNSRSVRVSRKVETAARSIPFLSSAVDGLLHPFHLLRGRLPTVELLSHLRAHYQRQVGLSIVVEGDRDGLHSLDEHIPNISPSGINRVAVGIADVADVREHSTQ